MKNKQKTDDGFIFLVILFVAVGFMFGRFFPLDVTKRLCYLDGWDQCQNFEWHEGFKRGHQLTDPTPVPTPTYLKNDSISRVYMQKLMD